MVEELTSAVKGEKFGFTEVNICDHVRIMFCYALFIHTEKLTSKICIFICKEIFHLLYLHFCHYTFTIYLYFHTL